MDSHVLIIQTKLRAAVKTFVQAGIGAAGTLFLAWILAEYTDITNGESVNDIDWRSLAGIVAVFCLMGISAIASLAMNWAKKAEAPPVVIDEPVVVE
jgi:hypothetical protein